MLFGVNRAAPVVLAALGLKPDAVPRFRDAYAIKTDAGEYFVVIHTRTGGGNRDYYENEESCRSSYPDYFEEGKESEWPAGPWNDELRAHPNYVRDEDDDFDSTYADFYFSLPIDYAPELKALADGGTVTPSEKWQILLEKLKPDADPADPIVAHATTVGKEIIAPIVEQLSK